MKKSALLTRHKWALPLEALMVIAAIVTLSQGNIKHFGVSLFTLAVSFAPLLLERMAHIKLPAWVHVVYVAFIFASMFSGEVLDMYARIWPWDDWVHFASGLMIGIGAIVWLTALEVGDKAIRLPVWLQSVFVCCIVAAVILLWEFAEFGSDEIFGTTSQDTLEDTMQDLLYGSFGAVIVAVMLTFHLRGRKNRVIDWVVASYTRLNS